MTSGQPIYVKRLSKLWPTWDLWSVYQILKLSQEAKDTIRVDLSRRFFTGLVTGSINNSSRQELYLEPSWSLHHRHSLWALHTDLRDEIRLWIPPKKIFLECEFSKGRGRVFTSLCLHICLHIITVQWYQSVDNTATSPLSNNANNNVLLERKVSNEPTWIPPSYIYYPIEYASIINVEKTDFSVVVFMCLYYC